MKKKLITVITIVAVLSIICISYFITHKNEPVKEKPVETAQMQPNFPFSIRMSMSSVIRRSHVIEIYGEPDKSYDIEDYSYDLWKLEDDSNLIAVYFSGSRLIHLCRYKTPLEKEVFKNIQVGRTKFEEIQGVDPYAYLFIGDTIAISEHILTDNVVLHIEYKQEGQEWVVDKMEFLDSLVTFPDIYDIP